MKEALAELVRAFPQALCVSTNGYITRDLYNLADRPENFYLVGSMGMAAPVGLGVAVARPGRRVLVLDGDGSFAMNPGVLPMIAEQAPDLVHVVLDNGAHESTGGQRPVAVADTCGLALAAGYRAAYRVRTAEQLRDLVVEATPALVHVACAPRTGPAGRRVELTPHQLVDRFRTALDGAA
ncbi:thiamine pyrophosphate-dependent enzyme [Kitasatospora sp. NPDC058965]|uniref:thiamine pyrophosphate-dependent enzyme n=1 Tax=Kitasatospora sp. NPDC058965 TaxID=3346682 RepID=UPI0036BDA8D2